MGSLRYVAGDGRNDSPGMYMLFLCSCHCIWQVDKSLWSDMPLAFELRYFLLVMLFYVLYPFVVAGHCAQYCTYSLMENDSKKILSIQVI
jgi:hypothetical protein